MDALLLSLEVLEPTFMVLAAIAGMWLLLTAISVPGTGAPEIGSLICLITLAAGAVMLPMYFVGALLLLAALGFFVAQLFYRHLRMLPLAGFMLQALGSFFLFQADQRPALPLLAAINLAAVAYYWLIFRQGLAIQDRVHAVGADPLIGARGQVISSLDPIGSVKIQGTIWRARAEAMIPGGAWVQVIGREGLELHVVPSESESLTRL